MSKITENVNIKGENSIFIKNHEGNHSYNAKGQSFKIAFINFIVGCLWVLLANQLIAFLIKDPSTFLLISILKGWFYVLVTSLFIFFLVFSALKKVIRFK